MAIRIGVIGCGAAARRIHLPPLRAAGFEVTAFASRSRASAEAAAAEWGGGAVLDTWQSLLERDDVDAVLVATPNAQHAEAAVAAARAGKHVLVEKPMATTVAEADAMVAAATDAGVVLMPAHNLRFASPFVAAAEAVARGDIGTVVAARAGFGHRGPEGWAPGSTWFRDPASSGGGALIDLGVHLVDVLHAVLADRVVEVAAFLSGAGAVEDSGQVEDSAQVLLRYAHGATATLHATWIASGARELQLTVFGTEGALHLDANTALELRIDGKEPQRLHPADRDRPGLHDGFAAAVRGEAAPPVTGQDGRAAIAVIEAAYASAAASAFSAIAF